MAEFQSQNPLSKHFRQPALYLKLPSGGKFWPEGTLELPLNNEIGIMPMCTKDEITLKTPDALLNGQGVVDVIQSCVPGVKDAWQMPSIDVDATIIAIRIASYGNQMDFTSVCPECKKENDYAIDLGFVLSNIKSPDYSKGVEFEGLTIKLRPQPYFEVNRSRMISFEEKQLVRTVQSIETGNEEESVALFNKQVANLINLNVDLLVTSTDSILLENGEVVTDKKFIAEFYNECESKLIKDIRSKLDELSTEGGIKPVDVNCKSCEHQFGVQIEFDFASFFANGS